MHKASQYYTDKLVFKPWGQEFVVYNEKNRLAITLVKINYGHKTSLHCHPKKKTGFIILSGTAAVQVGLYKENIKNYKPLSRLVLRPGLFHSLKAVSKAGLYALEFETPYKKNDLVRFDDNYGRQHNGYEGKNYTKKISNNEFPIFKKPKLGKKNYYFKNLKITISRIKNLKNFAIKKENSTTAILDGKLIDNRGQNVINYGEIVKSKTLKILSEKFKIKNDVTILTINKKIRK
jgi:mannose-6-phosphate isomerase-like protein (cupin superfamily)